MTTDAHQRDLAVFCATSGHSGVDRLLSNLLPAMASEGIRIDLLTIRRHGPYLGKTHPNIRKIPVPVDHVLTAFPHLVRYLKTVRVKALLSDKDRVNRTVLLAGRLARFSGRVMVRLGTTVSINLRSRSIVDRNLQLFSMRRLYPSADGVIFPSAGAADDFAKLTGMHRDRLWVIPNPIVTDHILHLAQAPPRHPWLTQKTLLVIAGFGELCARKDFETLVRAFARAQEQIPCRLILFGRGRRRAVLEELVRKLDLEDRVSLPGFVPSPYPEMAKVDLVVLSSRWEGFGNVLAEAMALGVPVVSTDCPSGPREILADGRYGPLVPVGDWQELARAIVRTLKSPLPSHILRSAAERYRVRPAVRSYLQALGLDGHETPGD